MRTQVVTTAVVVPVDSEMLLPSNGDPATGGTHQVYHWLLSLDLGQFAGQIPGFDSVEAVERVTLTALQCAGLNDAQVRQRPRVEPGLLPSARRATLVSLLAAECLLAPTGASILPRPARASYQIFRRVPSQARPRVTRALPRISDQASGTAGTEWKYGHSQRQGQRSRVQRLQCIG